MNTQNNNNNNRMFYNMNTQNDSNIHQNNSQQQQQQNYYSQVQQNQYFQQFNEQIHAQAMQQNLNYNNTYHHQHQQTNGMIPPPGLAYAQQGGFGQNGFSPYPQQVYQQQQHQQYHNIANQPRLTHQQNSISSQNQQQGNSNSYQQYQSSSQQQIPSLNQSPLQKKQSIQLQQQQSQNLQHQQQGQQKNKLQKQCSIQDDRITQASEEERSTPSYQHSQQAGNAQDEQLLEHLELSIFKIQPCPNYHVQHNHKQCQFYHGSKDKRRVGTNYSHDPCQFIDSFGANCPLGDQCPKSHNKVEQLYRPDKYKSKFCTFYPNKCSQCEYGIFCSFAHSEKEINTELIHNYEYDVDFYIFYYKTVWCPFNYINHDRGMCVYAHNWQDYRRKPHSIEFGYEPDACESWDPNSFITEYEIGCPNKQNCKKCHGWKEQEYHPKIYRTKPCQLQPCTKGKACPHYHNAQDKRFAPRNRITKGLFKTSQHLIPKEIKQQQQQGCNNNQTNGNGNVNSSSKLAQFSSSHSLSSQTNNIINNQQGFSESSQQNYVTQQVKKQTSLNDKKLRGNNVLMKMNTCIDLSTNIHEDSLEVDRQHQQFDVVYHERVHTPNTGQNLTQSPPMKKIMNKNSGNNQQQFKRCESQQYDEVATQNSTPQPQGQSNGQDEQRKQLRMTQPFALEELKDSGKKTAPNDSFSSKSNLSSTQQFNSDGGHNQVQQQNQSEYYGKDQLDMILSPYDQFDNVFTPQVNNRKIHRQNTQPNQEIGDQLNQANVNFNQQFGVQFDNNFAKFPPNFIQNNQNFQNISQQKNSILSGNKNNNMENTSKPVNENQDDEDYDQISELIHNTIQ